MEKDNNASKVDNFSDDEDDFGPPLPPVPKKKRQRPLINEELYLKNLPNSDIYEKSYMHRDTLSLALVSNSYRILITGSIDGHIKFWYIDTNELQFIKHYRAHFAKLMDGCISHDGTLLATIGKDKALKIYDIQSIDMINMISLSFQPLVCEFVNTIDAPSTIIAISCVDSSIIHLIMPSMENQIIAEITYHAVPVHTLKYHPKANVCISTDHTGAIELWHPSTQKFPNPTSTNLQISFTLKSETDLFELIKSNTHAVAITISPNGEYIAIYSSDSYLRIFRFKTAKLFRIYDETIDMYTVAQSDPQRSPLHLDKFDIGKRLAVERELNSTSDLYIQSLCFDYSSQFIIYPSLIGIKIVNIINNKLNCILGKSEANQRFLSIALFQSKHLKKKRQTNQKSVEDGYNYSLFATSFNKRRFYCFTRSEPPDDDTFGLRDVINEKPTKEEQSAMAGLPTSEKRLGKEATIHTTYGDIVVKLLYKETPRTVENFTIHSQNQYYDNCLFHRVIKGFMIQTGDPTPDLSGGESIWGGEFEDEIIKDLKHNMPFTLSMANAGPNTNGSQFFITTVPCPWLDGKHTVFGRVLKGMDVVTMIENVKTNSDDKPYEDIKIITIKITSY